MIDREQPARAAAVLVLAVGLLARGLPGAVRRAVFQHFDSLAASARRTYRRRPRVRRKRSRRPVTAGPPPVAEGRPALQSLPPAAAASPRPPAVAAAAGHGAGRAGAR